MPSVRTRAAAATVLGLCLVGFAPPKADEILLFGAPWCEACELQRKALDECGHPFQYVDVTTEAGFQAYSRIRAGAGGLPLVAMHGFRIQTWDLESFKFLLVRHLGLSKKKCKSSMVVDTSPGNFGGHAPAWWAEQKAKLAEVAKKKKGVEAQAAREALQLITLDMKLIKVPAVKK